MKTPWLLIEEKGLQKITVCKLMHPSEKSSESVIFFAFFTDFSEEKEPRTGQTGGKERKSHGIKSSLIISFLTHCNYFSFFLKFLLEFHFFHDKIPK